MTILQCSSGKLLVWDATYTDTFVPSNNSAAVTEAGALPAKAEQLKLSKYTNSRPVHTSQTLIHINARPDKSHYNAHHLCPHYTKKQFALTCDIHTGTLTKAKLNARADKSNAN